MRKKVCMVVQNPMVKGGIAAVVNGYRGSKLEKDYKIIYVESYKDGNKAIKFLKAITGYMLFIKVIVYDKPDIVHIHSSFGASFYRSIPFIFIASLAKRPIINHIHGADFNSFFVKTNKHKKKLIVKIYSKCSRLIALSSEWKKTLSQIVPQNKICVIENYSILHEDALEERLHRKSNVKVLFLGELGHRKGCYDIPEVAEKVVKEIPNVKFILCGSGNHGDEIAIRKLFETKKIENNVIFTGWIRNNEKDKILREADIFFLPSYNEGMPMSILDAMGYGLPIISTNVGGIPKIVHNEKNGMCFNSGDNNSFADEIIKLLKCDRTREQYACESFRIVKRNYSLEKHLQEVEKVYSLF